MANGSNVTVVIPARNAGATIERAVRSVVSPLVSTLLLVDHASEDDTVARALAVGRCPVHVVTAPPQARLGGVRQAGLDAVETPYMVGLDADDELVPGRIERMVEALGRGADIAADEAEIASPGDTTVRAVIPAFLTTPAPVRLFERNYLPAPGPIGARVDALRIVNYDGALHGPEDTDLLLRSIRAGLRFALIREVGYRIHALPTSLSRQRDNQRRMYRRLLMKHEPATIERLYRDAGLSRLVAWWGLVSFFAFRAEWGRAKQLLDRIEVYTEGDSVLEPDGPCPRTERWRVAFHRGTFELLAGEAEEARRQLALANELQFTPEGSNNYGVACRRLGREEDARAAFARALSVWPGFADARTNLASRDDAITTHPLRRASYRSDYAPAATAASTGGEARPRALAV